MIPQFVICLCFSQISNSQVITDGIVGPAVSLNGPDIVVNESIGSLSGRNLFHSFSSFDIAPGGSVTFIGSDDIANVISRVTGGSASSIAGQLTSAVGNANFYFFNPSGVVLTGSAAIDVPRSLHLSSASQLTFSDGAVFSAEQPQSGTLSMAVPELFGFLPQAGDLAVDNATVSISAVGSTTLAGANVLSDSSSLTIDAAALSLIAVGDSAAQLGLNESVFSESAGSISIQGNSADHVVKSSGDVFIRSGTIVIDSAHLEGIASATPNQQISIVAQQIDLLNGAEVAGDSTSQNGAIDINVVAESLTIDGQQSPERTGIYNQTSTTAAGGNIDISVGGQLRIVDGGEINTDSIGEGTGGDITVSAAGITLDRMAGDIFNGIASGAKAAGAGGSVDVTVADQLSIAGGAEITGSTSGAGDAGSVTVSAGAILLDGRSTAIYSTGISSQVNSDGTGNGGSVTVNATGATDIRAARISASTFGTDGNGGTIALNSGSLTIEDPGMNENFLTGVIAQTHGAGAGGDVSVVSDGALSLTNGGLISSGTFGTGDAGDVTVSATDIVLDRQGQDTFTGIASGVETSGDGGNVTVTANNTLSIAGGAEITGSTFGSGSSGAVTVSAGDIILDGGATDRYSTGISSQVNRRGTGNGGNVVVNATGAVAIRGGARITATTFGAEGDGGTIDLTSGSLTIEDPGANEGFLTGVIAQTHGAGIGGDVSVVSNGALSLINGGLISSGAFGTGNAGDVSVSATDIVLDRQGEDTFTGIASGVETVGDGGNVTVTANNTLSIAGGAEITGSTFGPGNSGAVTVNAGEITLDGSATDRYSTGISSQVNSRGTGNGGDVVVNATGAVAIQGGARITATTFGAEGDGGTIQLSSGSLTIKDPGANEGFLTGVIAQTHGAGVGGEISIVTDGTLNLINGGLISSGTFGPGNAGSLNVTAADIMLDRQGEVTFTGIASGVTGAGTVGNGGNVTVSASNSLTIADGAEITGSTFGAGSSGAISVSAAEITLDGVTSGNSTGISSQANSGSSGNGGSIDVRTGELQISRGARISVASFGSGLGGVANIDVNRLILFGHEDRGFTGIQSVADQASAGGLQIAAGSIALFNGYIVSTTFDGDADGGDIGVNSGVVAMSSGGVQANAISGSGGDINIDSDAVLADGGDLRVGDVERVELQFDGPNIVQAAAPGGVNGEIQFNAPELDVAALLSGLDSRFYDARSLGQNPCDAFTSGSQSSLVELSVGGIPAKAESFGDGFRTVSLQQNGLRSGSQDANVLSAIVQGPDDQSADAQNTERTSVDIVSPSNEGQAAAESANVLMKVKYQWSVVRGAPRIGGSVITSLAIGTQVVSLKKNGDWHQVRFEKSNSVIEGFMHHSVLEPVVAKPVSTSLNTKIGTVEQVTKLKFSQTAGSVAVRSHGCAASNS